MYWACSAAMVRELISMNSHLPVYSTANKRPQDDTTGIKLIIIAIFIHDFTIALKF